MNHTDKTSVEKRLIDIIIGSRSVDRTKITPDTRLNALGVSSLEALALAFDIEAEFGISVPDSEVYKLKTVGDVFDGVKRLIQEQRGADAS
ncbi:MAG: acyl carrier protein [Acidiferrobacterales bacterium]